MHFALPPRKTSRPPPYAVRINKSPFFGRLQRRTLLWIGAVTFAVILLLIQLRRAGTVDRTPAGIGPVVIVTPLDHDFSARYESMIVENRKDYASRHGYTTFFPNITDYDLEDPPSPKSWSKVPAMRHAITLFPRSTYFWYLSQHALIMNPTLSLEDHFLSRSRLESLMIVDRPVVPPDSVIKTFATRRAERVDLVLTQDEHGLCQDSFVLRQGEWAKFFLDAWFDPLYRSYNFQRADGHALEHLVQWHGTVLVRLAIVPQKIMNSYTRTSRAEERYGEGDLVAHFYKCDEPGSGRSCEEEVTPLYEHFASATKRKTA